MAALAFDTSAVSEPVSRFGTVGFQSGAAGNVPDSASAVVKLDIVATRAGFDTLETEWNALFERSGRSEQMFQQFNWLWHWANHYTNASTEFAIVTARREGRLVLVWPLVVERPTRLRQLAWMGDPVGQYGDVIAENSADLGALLEQSWSYLLSKVKPDLVRLTKVRSDAVVAPVLAAHGFKTTSREEAPHMSVAAHNTYEAFESRFSTKHLKNRRRQLRRLEERGPLELHHYSSGSEATDAIQLGMTYKRAWLNEKGLVSRAFSDTRIDAFFQDAVRGDVRPAGIEVSLLRSAGEGADVNISVRCKGRCAIHILAYSLKFERCSVGNFHLAKHIERAFATDVAVYDFLAPRHEYKMEWADGTVWVEDHALAVTALGRVYTDIYLAVVREGLKRAFKAMPTKLTRLFASAHRSTHSFL